MSHLFTQWGAVAAPKIMGQVDGGKPVRLFSWDTPAVGGEYTVFLHAFLPELKEFLQGCGWLEHTWFHISDEPNDAEADTFALAKASVADLLQDCKVMDALSSYQIYNKGIVEHPIVSADHMDAFLEEHVPHLWTYYCTVQAIKVPNRFIAMPSGRNRILGTLLYRYAIEGFLHWGFNFYNTKYSAARIDPFRVTDAGAFFPSGDPFLVYPAPDGTAYDSVRGAVLCQALADLRMLQLLESQIGRDKTVAMLDALYERPITFTDYPCREDFFEQLRAEIAGMLSLSDEDHASA
jgi:hypothetical protein